MAAMRPNVSAPSGFEPGQRKAIRSFRLRLHSGLRHVVASATRVLTQASSTPADKSARGPRSSLGWYIVGPLALRSLVEPDHGGCWKWAKAFASGIAIYANY